MDPSQQGALKFIILWCPSPAFPLSPENGDAQSCLIVQRPQLSKWRPRFPASTGNPRRLFYSLNFKGCMFYFWIGLEVTTPSLIWNPSSQEVTLSTEKVKLTDLDIAFQWSQVTDGELLESKFLQVFKETANNRYNNINFLQPRRIQAPTERIEPKLSWYNNINYSLKFYQNNTHTHTQSSYH